MEAPVKGHSPRLANEAPPAFSSNRLLAALPAAVSAQWSPHLVLTELRLGQVLFEAHQPELQVHFPTTAIVSLLYVLENGDTAEIAVVGRDGMVGVSQCLGGNSSTSRSVVQLAGWAWCLPAAVLKATFDRGGPVAGLMLRYVQALLAQMAQTAVCNRHHSIDKQLCRWILLSLDRMEGDTLPMTQGLIADMLGVRREGVTVAAAKLQRAGLIRYARGSIRVLDRSGLEERSCECYAVVEKEYQRLLPLQQG
jgi:CRP-like cAMP-binding protein